MTYIISVPLKIHRVLFKTTVAIYLSLESVFSIGFLGEGRAKCHYSLCLLGWVCGDSEMAQGLERNYLIIWWWKTYGAQIHTTQICDRPHRSPRCSTSGCVMSQTPARCGCLHESESLSESRVCSDGSGVHEPPVYITSSRSAWAPSPESASSLDQPWAHVLSWEHE